MSKSSERQIHLAAFNYGGMYGQSWRHPAVDSTMDFSLAYQTEYARTAERGLLDAIFMADESSQARPPSEMDMLKRMSSSTAFEPITLMTALAARTERIGLMFTASSTYYEPYNLARLVGSLDHLSAGRAGWNLVTSNNVNEAPNFGRPIPPHAERYARAREFYDVVTGLWDSFDDDAFRRDKESGVFFDPDKLHAVNFQGKYFQVRGPLRMARPPQGHPVIAQAGASEPGRQLGAETADVIFCAAQFMNDSQAFFADIKGRAERAGRQRDDVKILPGVSIIWGSTMAEAEDKFDAISKMWPLEIAIQGITGGIGLDITQYDPDDLFPELPPSNGIQGHQRAITEFAKRGNLTIRQTAQRLAASIKHRTLVGTTQMIADDMEAWFLGEACDGFILIPPYQLQGLQEFIEHVVPELQRRGLFRTAYTGRTLREHLGVPRPPSRYASA
ncbi:LLM class flavin-dependent oxidoreductase [Acidisphaera sp. L21]|uniref:LLM class flavin-dependent oxidoreductase n=1 Tax=Acidisphaera sp. L21 TaxID=1641851 RepID=UPI0020B1215D|nr:LLM class flavin-dependent oxidoreductase [Acidisphaera sp. L21]